MATVTVSYLVVAGGGGAGSGAGGGGAGGLLTGSTSLTTGTSYAITVGAGGPSDSASNGSNSSAFSLTAIGGGSCPNSSSDGNSGGSGGGGGRASNIGGAGTAGQGYAGGNASTLSGGGGGGAGSVGSAGSPNTGGGGGVGVASSITGSSVFYAGGGGAWGSSTGGTGGNGGGGSGNLGTGNPGTVNTGGGGGSGASGSGAGGSGVVIISLLTSQYSSLSPTTGSPTITTSGSNTIIKFTSSGTITLVAPPTAGAGGSGGGGTGGLSGNGVAGTTNTGSGGGGAGGTGGSTQYGGAGGSGVIVFSYTSTSQLYTGGTITTSGGNYIHTFTSSGTLQPTIPLVADSNVGATTNMSAGNTAQRSTWAGTGSTRYNSTTGTVEWYNSTNTTWYALDTFMYLDGTDSTGAAIMPAGNTLQRNTTLGGGGTRYNSTLGTLEWYNATTATWTPLNTFMYLDATGANGAAIMPTGNTAQRDATLGYGSTRFNTTTGTLEWYNSNTQTWNSV